MSELLTIAAIVVGFVSAICFCIGGLSGAKQISVMAGTYWNYNEPLARSLAAQQAQYIVGALLLVASFGLQAAAVLAGQATAQALPQWLPRGACLFLVVLAPTAFLAWLAVRVLAASTTKKVLHLLKKPSSK